LGLEPTSWEDRNDAYYLERYKEAKKLKTVLACCFAAKRETFHHWKVFANGSGGVCVEFSEEKLLRCVRKIKCTRTGKVQYPWISENSQPSLETWPFLKRRAFVDEGEFRIIYENPREVEATKQIPIKLSCIQKITLSPWSPRSVAETVMKIIHGIDGCDRLKVSPSSLLDNSRWRECLDWSGNGKCGTKGIGI
jgi:hypothetical protein